MAVDQIRFALQRIGQDLSCDPIRPLAGESPLVLKVEGPAQFHPVRAYSDDAGLDLFVSERTVIPYGKFVDVPCGIKVQFPCGYWGMITGRSSTLRKRQLLVHTGIIDEGYRGELFAGVWNMSDSSHVIEAGERIAQLILYQTAPQLHVQAVAVLDPSPRGNKGFGSSGH